jgi:asparagine synthase (glutamine-hydrolysing)
MLDGAAREIEACGVGGYGDLYTFMALNYYTCDANFRMPDIAGLQAQVEVRSPFLDHRMVEFAARLPIRFKIGDIDNATYNKLLPKRYYARHVADDLAWADKKGMGWNIRFGDSFARDPDFRSAYEGALQAVADVGLDAERFRGAWDAFTRDKLAGVLFPPTGGVMMAGFMLGRWLQVHDRRATALPGAADV